MHETPLVFIDRRPLLETSSKKSGALVMGRGDILAAYVKAAAAAAASRLLLIVSHLSSNKASVL